MRVQLYTILLGCAAIVLGGVVLARNLHGTDDDLLASGLIAAGVAIILAALPRGA